MERDRRLAALIAALRGPTRVGPADLAARLGVSTRTVFRDLRRLVEAGLPVRYQAGYRLDLPGLIPPVHLTGDEAFALKVAAGPRRAGRAPLAGVLERALAKLELSIRASLPPVARGPRQMSLAFCVPEEVPEHERILGALGELVADGRRAIIRYARAGRGQGRPVEVEPAHLTRQPDGWALVAFVPGERRLRTFPLAWIRAVGPSPRPARARAAARRRRVVPRAPAAAAVEVRLSGRVARGLAAAEPGWPGKVAPAPDGSAVATLAVSDPAELLPWLLALGSEVEVLAPPDLRARVRAVADEVARKHAG
jgi:predicted DNA-binding transcriptional regulator YafY